MTSWPASPCATVSTSTIGSSSQVESLRGALAEVLEKLACGYGAQGDFAAALASARRWLAMDPLREEAHRQVMRLYAWSGQRNAAMHQYRECVGILEQELGVTPLAETTELYEAIKGNTLPEHVDPRSLPKPIGSPASSAVDLASDCRRVRPLSPAGRSGC